MLIADCIVGDVSRSMSASFKKSTRAFEFIHRSVSAMRCENGQWVAIYSDSHRNIEHPLTSRLRRSERATSLLTSPTSLELERCSQIVHCGSNRGHATNNIGVLLDRTVAASGQK